MRIWCGNLSYNSDANDLREWLRNAGFVATDIKVITNRDTGHSKGFAFAEVKDARVVEEMNGRELHGRSIVVNEAKPLGSGQHYRPPARKQQWDNRDGTED